MTDNELPKNSKAGANIYIVWIVVLILSVIISSLSGVLLGKSRSVKKETALTYTLTKPAESLPIPLSIFQNPMFSEWSGRVQGRVKNKVNNKIELTAVELDFGKDGRITVKESLNPNVTLVSYIPGLTQIFATQRAETDNEPEFSAVSKSLDDLALGAIINGSVKVFYDNNTKTFELTGVSLSIMNYNE